MHGGVFSMLFSAVKVWCIVRWITHMMPWLNIMYMYKCICRGDIDVWKRNSNKSCGIYKNNRNMHCRHKSRAAIIKLKMQNLTKYVHMVTTYQQQYPYTTKCNGEHSYIWYIPYCLKLRPVLYKCRILISDLGIARYNIT